MTSESLEILSSSERETHEFGVSLGRQLRSPLLILLSGPLGAGKSVLARGIARGMGVTEPVRSPTFTLINQHQGRLPLAHCDLYRLEPGDMRHLGLDELLQGAVLVVEWAEKWTSAPGASLHIAISGQNDSRTLRIEGPVDAVALCRAAKEAQDTDSGD